jgi:hypothetical protein
MGLDISEGTDRVLATLDGLATQDNCPVRKGHHKMLAPCAVCGAPPPETPQQLPSQVNRFVARAEPGNWWWEPQIGAALARRDVPELTRLVELAESQVR